MERAESIESHNCRANALKFSPEGLGLRYYWDYDIILMFWPIPRPKNFFVLFVCFVVGNFIWERHACFRLQSL